MHRQLHHPQGVGAVVGGALAAAGVAVVAVLTLRAMGEWRTIKEERALAEAAEPPKPRPSREPAGADEPDRPTATRPSAD